MEDRRSRIYRAHLTKKEREFLEIEEDIMSFMLFLGDPKSFDIGLKKLIVHNKKPEDKNLVKFIQFFIGVDGKSLGQVHNSKFEYLIKTIKIHEIAKKNGIEIPFYYFLIETPNLQKMDFILNKLHFDIQEFIDYRNKDRFRIFKFIFGYKPDDDTRKTTINDFYFFSVSNNPEARRTQRAQQIIICKIGFWKIDKLLWIPLYKQQIPDCYLRYLDKNMINVILYHLCESRIQDFIQLSKQEDKIELAKEKEKDIVKKEFKDVSSDKKKRKRK